jgi:4-amino-4-deoxy-L-arabinose transferase-like glycosyltransferase
MSDMASHLRSLAGRVARPPAAVALLLILGAALRVPNLGESLWLDEVLYSTREGLRVFGGLWRTVTSAQHGAGYPALLYAWTAVVPETEVWLRLPSLAFGVGSIVLTYAIARRYGSREAALLAALFLCLSPVHVWYSQEATPYAAALCLLLAAVHLQPRITASAAGLAWLLLYVIVLAAAVLCHAYAAVLLLPLTLAAVRMPRRAAALVAGANLFAGLVLIATLAIKYQGGRLRLDPGFTRPFTPGEWWTFFFGYLLQGHTLWSARVFRAGSPDHAFAPLALAVQIAAAAVLARGLLTKPREAEAPRWQLAAYLLTLPLVLLAATFIAGGRLYLERYLFIVLPFFAIALARGALAGARPRVRAAVAGAILVLAAASYGMLLHKDTVWTVYKPNPDWRSTARHLREAGGPPGRMVLVGTIPLNDLTYYLRREMGAQRPAVRLHRSRRLNRLLANRRIDRVVLVHNRFWVHGFDRALVALQRDPRLRYSGVASFKGVDLHTFERRLPQGHGPADGAARASGELR